MRPKKAWFFQSVELSLWHMFMHQFICQLKEVKKTGKVLFQLITLWWIFQKVFRIRYHFSILQMEAKKQVEVLLHRKPISL